jgi:hypothetical protein
MNAGVLPICAIVPCKDNMSELPQHVASLLQWLHRVQHVVVVDSSSDGSLDFLREQLKHDDIEFHTLAPGLFDAWNFAVGRARAELCYFATVGDTITLAGLEHLAEVQKKTGADIVVSPPRMVTIDGEPSPGRWPIHYLAEYMTDEVLQLDRDTTVRALCGIAPYSLLGSAASNLYRTALLRGNPFLPEFAKRGDSAFGVMVAPIAKLAVTRRIVSDFVLHTDLHPIYAEQQLAELREFVQLIDARLAGHTPDSPASIAFDAFQRDRQVALMEWLASVERAMDHRGRFIEELKTRVQQLEADLASRA